VRPHVGGCSRPTVAGGSRGRDEEEMVFGAVGLVVVDDEVLAGDVSRLVDEGEGEVNIGSTKHCSAHSQYSA
jgi:hypothetical protein